MGIKLIVSAVSYPPSQKARERGTHSFGTGKESGKPGPPVGGGGFGSISAANEAAWLASGSIPWYSVAGGELYLSYGFFTADPNYDAAIAGSLLGTYTSALVDLGPLPTSDISTIFANSPTSDGGSGANNGFTLGIRAPGQTYSQCLAANSSTYSINNWLPSSAQNGATKFALGNDVSNALFGDANEGTAGLVVDAGVAAAPLGVGTAGTFGRRTASIFNLNLSGTTGPAPTILGKTGAAEVVGWVSGAFELKLAADIGATAAEALNCIGHR